MAVDADLLAVLEELLRLGIEWDQRHRMRCVCPDGRIANFAAGKVGDKLYFSSLFVRDADHQLLFGHQYLSGHPNQAANDPDTEEYLRTWIAQNSRRFHD